MGPNFFETKMGREFYQGTMPSIARSLATIAEEMKKQEKKQKEKHVKWFFISVTGLQEGADCISEDVCGPNGGFKKHEDVFRAMGNDIAEYVSMEIDKEVFFDTLDEAIVGTPYKVNYSNYAAELYKDGKATAIWRIVRVPD